MTITAALVLFGSMVVLALVPGPGILAVVGRTLTAGLPHGISTTIGIVVGDYVFISFALLGLAALSEVLGSFFAVVRYAGAVYLIYLGLSVLLAKGARVTVERQGDFRHLSSFVAGLVITLSNPKAILFYLSFLPTLMDLSSVSTLDVAVVYLAATVAVGGAMYGYAYVAHRAKGSLQLSQANPLLRGGTASLLIGAGIYVAVRG